MAKRRGPRGFGEPFQLAASSRKRRFRPMRWLGRIVALIIFVLLLPYLLLPLYRLDFVKPVSTLMLRDAFSGPGYERQWADFDAIAPVLVQSVMMSEDGQFCAHDGVDWDALNLVLDGALEGESTRGASTIPMQTVKNLYLWPGRSYLRKALEIPLAMAADYVWPKTRTMELYLNAAEWAPGVYGAEAGARHHFGVSASQLSPRQAALMAVTLPNPALRTPSAPTPGLSALADNVEIRARQSGAYIGCLYN